MDDVVMRTYLNMYEPSFSETKSFAERLPEGQDVVAQNHLKGGGVSFDYAQKPSFKSVFKCICNGSSLNAQELSK